MKKNILLMGLLLSTSAFALNDGFNFTECSGSGSFEQQIVHYNGDYESAVIVGTIPTGIEGLTINLNSDKDVDIRLYGQNNDKIVHWPHGLLNQDIEASTNYMGTEVTYSGYNGVDGEYGHEFIKVDGTTQTPMVMKAFGYKAGFATVNYSWTGVEGCDNTGDGNFTQSLVKDALSLVGEIPAGIPNVEIILTSDNDLDIQLYGEDGTVIVGWKPEGILHGPRVASIDYNDMNIEWSGYNGTDGNKGHEYIKITGNTTEVLTMKVFGYEAGFADISYSWHEDNNTEPTPTPQPTITPTPTPEPCTDIYEPVCGEDTAIPMEVTYSNICKLENAGAVYLHNGECSTNNYTEIQEELNSNLSLWQSQNITEYTFDSEISNMFSKYIKNSVSDGILTIVDYSVQPASIEISEEDKKTINGYFELIQDAIVAKFATIAVTYDPIFGHPIYIELDKSKIVSDDEIYYYLDNFIPNNIAKPEQGNQFIYPYNIVDNIFLPSSNTIAILSTQPSNTLTLIDTNGTLISTLLLNNPPAKMALSEDGNRLVISSDARVMLIDISDITNLQLLNTYSVPADLGDIAIHNDFIYAIETNGQWDDLYSIDMNNGQSTKSSYSSFGYASYGNNPKIIINHSQQSLYILDSDSSPQDINKFDISKGNATGLYDSPYHGDYKFCNNMWMLSSEKIITACATTLLMDTNQSFDMIYDGKFNSSSLIYNSYGNPETMIKSISVNEFEENSKIVVGIGKKTFGYETFEENIYENIIEIYTQEGTQLEQQIIVSKDYTHDNKKYQLFIENAYLTSNNNLIVLYRAVLENSFTHKASTDKFIFETISID